MGYIECIYKDEVCCKMLFISPRYLKKVNKEESLNIRRKMKKESDKYPEIELEYLDIQLTIDQQFLELANKYKEKYKLCLLSNDVSEWSKYLRKKFGLNEIFDEIIISGDVGLRKPDKAIYKLLLITLQASPEDCVLVDDNLNNINAAAEFGIKTIRFVRENEKAPFCSEFEVKSFSELLNVLANFY